MVPEICVVHPKMLLYSDILMWFTCMRLSRHLNSKDRGYSLSPVKIVDEDW